MNEIELKNLAVEALEALQANDITVIDVAELTTITSLMIVCSARSSRHLKSLANNLIEHAKTHNHHHLGLDGEHSSEWILVDLGDVIVHIMMPETRTLYEIEKLWTMENHPDHMKI